MTGLARENSGRLGKTRARPAGADTEGGRAELPQPGREGRPRRWRHPRQDAGQIIPPLPPEQVEQGAAFGESSRALPSGKGAAPRRVRHGRGSGPQPAQMFWLAVRADGIGRDGVMLG